MLQGLVLKARDRHEQPWALHLRADEEPEWLGGWVLAVLVCRQAWMGLEEPSP